MELSAAHLRYLLAIYETAATSGTSVPAPSPSAWV